MPPASVLTRSRAIALLAASSALAPRQTRAQVPPLRVGGSLTSDSGVQAYFAQEAGFFTKAGLAVELTSFPNTGGVLQAVAGNALDVGIADMIQLGNAALHGVQLGFFAGGGMYSTTSPTVILCVPKASPIRTAKDLEGQTIAVVALATQSSVSTIEWLQSNGADVSKIKLYEIPFPQMSAALEHGTVQAATVAEPFLSFVRNDVRVLTKPFDVIAKSFYINGWFAPREWASHGGNTVLLKRYAQVMYDTARWANAHQDDTLAMLTKFTKIDIDRVRTMARVRWATSLDPRLMQPVLDIGAKYKLIEHSVAANDLILRTA